MAGKKNHEKQLYWQDIINRQAASGLSVRQFCTQEHVSEPSFYVWRRKFQGEAKGQSQTGTPGRRGSDSSNGREFIPLKLLETSDVLEVIHPLGYRIRVVGQVDVTALERVLDVLDGRSDR